MLLRKAVVAISTLCMLATAVVAASGVWWKLFDGKSLNGLAKEKKEWEK